MRVLLVNDQRPGPGSGAEVHVNRLAAALASSGDVVTVFAPDHPSRGVARLADVWNPSIRSTFRRCVDAFGPDIIHFHNFLRELSPAVLSVAPGTAKVLTVHDHRLLLGYEPGDRPWSAGSLARRLTSAVSRAASRRAIDEFVAVSMTVAAGMQVRGLRPVRVVPPLADVEPTGGDTEARQGVIYVGRLSPAKGVDTLIMAWAAIATEHTAHKLEIVGDGPSRADLESLAGRLAPDRVVFRGQLDEREVRTRLCRARIACLPSTADEGAPTALIEAMLAGCAVVASDVPGTHEMLDGGALGRLLASRDRTAWSRTLGALLHDGSNAAALGSRARDVARARYRPDRVVARLHEAYRDALRRG